MRRPSLQFYVYLGVRFVFQSEGGCRLVVALRNASCLTVTQLAHTDEAVVGTVFNLSRPQDSTFHGGPPRKGRTVRPHLLRLVFTVLRSWFRPSRRGPTPTARLVCSSAPCLLPASHLQSPSVARRIPLPREAKVRRCEARSGYSPTALTPCPNHSQRSPIRPPRAFPSACAFRPPRDAAHSVATESEIEAEIRPRRTRPQPPRRSQP